jgi:hypothetical protein
VLFPTWRSCSWFDLVHVLGKLSRKVVVSVSLNLRGSSQGELPRQARELVDEAVTVVAECGINLLCCPAPSHIYA